LIHLMSVHGVTDPGTFLIDNTILLLRYVYAFCVSEVIRATGLEGG